MYLYTNSNINFYDYYIIDLQNCLDMLRKVRATNRKLRVKPRKCAGKPTRNFCSTTRDIVINGGCMNKMDC